MVNGSCVSTKVSSKPSSRAALNDYSPFTIYYSLTIYLPEHNVERADDCDHVRDEVAYAHLPKRL